MKNKLAWTALVVGLLTLVLYASRSMAAEPLFLDYGGMQFVKSAISGQPMDKQARFQFTPATKTIYTHEYWGIPTDVKFAVTGDGTGFLERPSTPVSFSYMPQVWAEVDISDRLSWDVIVLNHQSNGRGVTIAEPRYDKQGELEQESAGWNRTGSRFNYAYNSGPWSLTTSGFAFWVMDSESDALSARRTIGSDGGRFGGELTAQLVHADYGSVQAEVKSELYMVSATLDVLDGEMQPFVYWLNGFAALFDSPNEHISTFGVGVSTDM